MSKKRIGEIIGGVFCILFALLVGICTFYLPEFSSDPKLFYRLNVTLAQTPEIVKRSKQPDEIVFRFKEYPNISFAADANYFAQGTMTELHPGDATTIIVLKEEYRRSVNHNGNFFEHLVSNRPDLYGFVKDGKIYIDFKKIEADRMDPVVAYSLILFIVIGVFFAGVNTLFFKSSK